MIDSFEPSPADLDQDATSSEELGHSYDSLLDQQSWQVDLPDEMVPVAAETPAENLSSQSAPQETATPPSPVRIVEAMLFIGGPPLTAAMACDAVRGLTEEQFTQAVDSLNLNYRRQGRPYAIQSQGTGFVMSLRPHYRPVFEKLYGKSKEARLSQAAIDVLSLVAYRQPASKQEIDTSRGIESGAVIRQLIRRGLVAVVQRGEAAQREVFYGTTQRFLDFFGLGSLEDLPQTQDLQRL